MLVRAAARRASLLSTSTALSASTAAGATRRAQHERYADVWRFFTTLARRREHERQQQQQWAAQQGRARNRQLGWATAARRAYSQEACDKCGSQQQAGTPAPKRGGEASTSTDKPAAKDARHPPHASYLSSLPLAIRRLARNLPAPPGRPPSVDDLLGVTTGVFERLRIRFKWLTIRSYRRFRADDYSAFFSVGILTAVAWFLAGTTSFAAFLFFVLNSLQMQEFVARRLGQYLTRHTGVTVVFESAIVPKWGLLSRGEESRIVFRNVFLSRGLVERADSDGESGEGEGGGEGEAVVQLAPDAGADEVSRWTRFHLSIDKVEVSLSLRRWLDGHGLVHDAAVDGVRGVVDRSHIVHTQHDSSQPVDRHAYRHQAKPGDFWLEGLRVSDFLVTIYQPDGFRPYTFSIFNADIKRLRKQWLFYDLMSAESITGQVDNCLFSLHKPQSIGRTSQSDLEDAGWARMSRFRIDGLPLDHLQSSTDTSVLSWVVSGRVDLMADIRFPRPSPQQQREHGGPEQEPADLGSIVAEIVENLESTIISSGSGAGEADEKRARIPGQRVLSKRALESPSAHTKRGGSDKVLIDLDLRFKDVKAHVPLLAPAPLSYINSALVRPIVAFVNANRTLVPVTCRLELDLDDFDGSWTTYDVGLLDRMSEEVYGALAHHVQSAQKARERIQTVSLWTLQMTANAVLNLLKDAGAQSHWSQ